MEIKPELEAEYKSYVEKNSADGYSKACIDAGEAVGVLLDEGKTPEEAEKGLYGQDLTGYMAGVVASAIGHFHPRGEEFRVFWNKGYGVGEETKGTVNPAIITLKD